MARVNGSGFKMKSSPTKGILSDFFQSIGAKKTDMNELRAKQRRSSKGISEFEYRKTNPRVKKAKPTSSLGSEFKPSALSPTAGTDRINKTLDLKKTKSGLYDPSKPKLKPPSAQEMINMAYKGTNDDWDKASKNAMDMYGTTLTELISKRDSPVEKKSPSKKRGYKMKRKK
jgi:hypothetical protein